MPQNTWMFNKTVSESALGYAATFGFAGGIGANYHFNDNMGAELGVLFSMQGQKYELDGLEIQTKTSYLKIPVLFNINTSPDGAAMFDFAVGPQFGLLMSAKDEEDIDVKDGMRSMDIGVAYRIGAKFNLSDNLQLGTHLRGDYAFTDAFDPEVEGDGYEKTTNVTNGLMISLTYLFQ